jgi:hypothetical protein
MRHHKPVHAEPAVAFSLACHPDTPATGVEAVEATLQRTHDRWVLTFQTVGIVPVIPAPAAPGRTDGLWNTTCFELFIRGDTDDYVELNFSPSTRWAAYHFPAYRTSMSDLEIAPPCIEPVEDGVRVTMAYAPDDLGRCQIALCAVIEEVDGTKSYWALKHPPGKPDFHHPDCFARTLPAFGER